jgi:hypothetical protein
MELESSSLYPQVPAMSLFLLRLRDTSSRNAPPPPAEIRMGEYFTSGLFCLQRKHLSWVILNMRFLRRGVVSTSPNPHAGGPPLVGCPRLLIHFIHSCPPYRRPFLHPQPEDAPCRGNRDPHSWQVTPPTVNKRSPHQRLWRDGK